MNAIEKMLSGHMDMSAFISALKYDENLQTQICDMLPNEAINERSHALWKKISYDSLKKAGFNFLHHLQQMHRFDGSIEDNLNIFGSIYAVYSF